MRKVSIQHGHLRRYFKTWPLLCELFVFNRVVYIVAKFLYKISSLSRYLDGP